MEKRGSFVRQMFASGKNGSEDQKHVQLETQLEFDATNLLVDVVAPLLFVKLRNYGTIVVLS